MSHSSNYQNNDQIIASKAAEDKSDEQKKNDLINEKLFKLNSFQGSKGQAPARQKSIEKGSETQKIKTKKLKERQSVINPSRDANDGSPSAIIKQELSNDTVCLSNPQGKSSTYISLESNDIKTEDQLNQNHKYDQGFPESSILGMSNSYGLIGDGANNLSSFNSTGHEEPARITNQTSSGYNEFAVPGNILSSSRNETSIRKKVSGHSYLIYHSAICLM